MPYENWANDHLDEDAEEAARDEYIYRRMNETQERLCKELGISEKTGNLFYELYMEDIDQIVELFKEYSYAEILTLADNYDKEMIEYFIDELIK